VARCRCLLLLPLLLLLLPLLLRAVGHQHPCHQPVISADSSTHRTTRDATARSSESPGGHFKKRREVQRAPAYTSATIIQTHIVFPIDGTNTIQQHSVVASMVQSSNTKPYRVHVVGANTMQTHSVFISMVQQPYKHIACSHRW
jgi:hypothetical protein